MSFENEIAAAMHAHDDEAPTSSALTLPRRRPPTWLAAVAAAAVVLLVAVAVVAVRSHDTTSTSRRPAVTAASPTPTAPSKVAMLPAAPCPKQYLDSNGDGWVPHRPPAGLAIGRLTPTTTPGSVTICSYVGGRRTGASKQRIALTGRRTLSNDLAAVPQLLSLEPRKLADYNAVCTTNLEPTDGDNFLIALSYPAGTIWVAAPGFHCAGATNGGFTTTANLRAIAAASFKAHRWVADPPPDSVLPSHTFGPCERGSAGRLGQDKTLVPAGVVSLDICVGQGKADGTAVPPHHVSKQQAQYLVNALNDLPTRHSTWGCVPTTKHLDSYQLHFYYRSGPQVVVRVTVGCRPAIDNSDLQATSNGSVIEMIEALVR